MKEPKHATATARTIQLSRKKAPRPRKVANSAQRSTRESTSAPRGLATPACRATPPSRTSSVPATMVSQPPTKSHPAQNAAPASMLTASCAQVTASGWTRASTTAPSSGASGLRYRRGRRGPTSGAAGPGAAPASGMRASPRSASHTVTATTRVAAAAVPGRQAGATASVPLALDLPAQEGLDPLLGEIVGQLARGVLHQVGGHAQEGAADLPISRHAAAADGVDHAARGVGAVLDRQPELELDGRVGEAAALDAEETDLVVALAGDVVARTDVDAVARERGGEHALHRLGLRAPLGAGARVVQHVEEVRVAAGVQLVRPVEHDAAIVEQLGQHAMNDGRPELRLDVVTHDRDAAALELAGPLRIRDDEHRDAVHERHPGLEAGARVVLGCRLAADREVVDHHLGAAAPEHLDHVDRPALGHHEGLLRRVVAHVLGHAVEDGAHLDDHARARQLGVERAGVVGRCERGHLERLTHLALVDVEGTHDLDVARAVAAHVVVHEADVRVGGLLVGGTIEFDALQEAARAVAHPHDADSALPHTPHSRARPPPARARARLIYSTGGGL